MPNVGATWFPILVALAVYTAGTARAMSGYGPIGPFEVHGHRGARASEPENSLWAFDFALRHEVGFLELDLVVSRDGVLVINHDLRIRSDLCISNSLQLNKRKGPWISDLTLAEIKSYDCGSRTDPEFPKRALRPNTPILTFAELLSHLNHSQIPHAKQVRLNIETKLDATHPSRSPTPERFVEMILVDLKRNGFPLERVVLQSFDFRTLKYARKIEPAIQISALVSRDFDVDRLVRDLQPNYISPNASFVNKEKLGKAHYYKVKMLPWTLNKPSHWSHFRGMGVDGIITDDPAGLMRQLNRRSTGNPKSGI